MLKKWQIEILYEWDEFIAWNIINKCDNDNKKLFVNRIGMAIIHIIKD